MERRDILRLATGAAALATQLLRADTRPPDQIAADEDFWFRVRHAYTLDRNIVNLNNGSVSPSPFVVQRALQRYEDFSQMQPSLYVDEVLGPGIEHVRKRLAAAADCDPEELAITRNTTESLEAVQFGMELKAGDEVLTTTQDYPSMLTAWRQRERRDGIVMKMVPFPTPPPSMSSLVELFEHAITPRTKVILFCHITYTTGQIFPAREICQMARARGVETIVDGGHAFAHFPFSLRELGCDYYGSSLHKWLSAPIGTGLLYVRKEKIGKIWTLFATPESMKHNIRKFESIGTSPTANRNAITEALDFHESLGIERKAARLQYLRERWSRRVAKLENVKILTPLDPKQGCALGAMRIEGIESGNLTNWLLKKHRIHVRPRFVPGEFDCIRVTPHVYSTLQEIDSFCEAIEEAAKSGIA